MTAPKLETRKCAVQCDRTFRVLETSPNWFCSESHARAALTWPIPEVKAKAKRYFAAKIDGEIRRPMRPKNIRFGKTPKEEEEVIPPVDVSPVDDLDG